MVVTDEESTKQLKNTPDNSRTISQQLKEYLLTKSGGSDGASSYYVVGKKTPTGVSVHEGVSREEAAQIIDAPISEKRREELEKWKEETLTKFEGLSNIIKTIIKTIRGY